MPVNTRPLLACLLFAAAMTACSTARAQALNQILPAISSPSPANIRVAEDAWKAQDPAAIDVLTRYAMSLALANNNRHQQAFDLLDAIPLAARKAGPLRRLRVWLVIRLRKDDLAQAELQSLVEELKTRSAKEPTANDLEDVQFLAKVVGYLEHVAEREAPLTPQQAKTWWTALENLPATWNQELPPIKSAIVAAHDQRKKELEDAFKPWRAKTENDLAGAQQRVLNLGQQEMAAKNQLMAAVAAEEAFAAQARPQLAAMQASANQLIIQRNAIRRPEQPDKPEKDKNGKTDRNAEREYDRDMEEYRRDKRAYDSKIGPINSQLAGLDNQAALIHRQEAQHQTTIRNAKAAHRNSMAPLQLATKEEQRLMELLADRPAWDSPGSLATLRAIDLYATFSFTAEVDRIIRTRNK